jgi:signal transduction histidine kinase
MQEITEKLMENILDMVNQKVQDALKKFQDTENKENEKIQKQINELREDFSKHQSETKNIIEKEIYELKKTTENIKEELKENMKTSEKKNQIEILEIKSPFSQTKNTMEGHSSKLE